METTFNQTANINYSIAQTTPTLLSSFLAWCQQQEEHRFGWLGGIIAAHGCLLTPITLFAVILSGSSLPLFIVAIVAMGMSLVTNLAAMPTRVTIPVFFLSVLIDLIVIGCSLALGFNLAAANL